MYNRIIIQKKYFKPKHKQNSKLSINKQIMKSQMQIKNKSKIHKINKLIKSKKSHKVTKQ